MGSNSKTSTLLSTCSFSKARRTYSRNGGSNRYVVGSIGKGCVKQVNKNSQEQQRHQNVAIATQVINPSAIGGSLKNRRFVEHFGPSGDDDEISFLSNKRRSTWGKVCCYGISIAVTVLMMTGLVLAVGYMQSEKQKITTRPVKLAQGQTLEEGNLYFDVSTTTHLPSSILPATTTTTESSSISESNDLEEDEMDEIGLDDYVNEDTLQKLDHVPNEDGIFKESSNSSDREEGISEKSSPHSSNIATDDFNANDPHREEYDQDNQQKQFSEVKVLPPADFAFNGISLEFPIYRSKNKTNTTSITINHATIATNSGSAAPNQETKELETSINDVNSNFTSFINSFENNKDEEEKVLLSPLQEEDENYANALSEAEENDLKEPDSLSSSSHSQDSTNNYHTETDISNDSKDKSSSSRINDDYENVNNKKNDFDFDTAPTASLQTDIFDNNDDEIFEISASEETRKNSSNKKINEEYEVQPPRPKQQNNSYIPKGSRNNNHVQKSSTYSADYFEEDKPRTDPRKLSLRPKSYRKMRLKGSNHDIVQNQENKLKNDEFNESPSPPNSNTLTVPILDYKVDFSKLVTPTPSPSPEIAKVDFQFQPHQQQVNSVNSNSYSDFKFDFTTTPSPSTNFNIDEDLKEFIRKNDEAHSLKFDLTSVPATNSEFNTQHFSGNSISSNNLGSNLGIGTGSSGPLTFSSDQQQPDQLSKRTFYNYDFDPSASGTTSFSNTNVNTNSNPFAHLLGPQPTSGSFGSATSTGATINLFQPQGQQSNFNFDTTNSGSFNIPSGTVPVDLSASHIQVNNPSTSYGLQSASSQPFFTIDANGAFSLTNPSNLPYPNISPSSNFATNQGNDFSFSNLDTNSGGYGSASSGSPPILTTGNGQVPTYNTITQGIHLLNLLSGNNHKGFSATDQQSSASSSIYQPQQQSEISTKPEYQIAALTGYGGSSNQFFKGLENKWENPINNEANHGHAGGNYAYDFFPRKSFRSVIDNSGDQDSSASFSKSIVSKVTGLGNSVKAIGSLTTSDLGTTTTQPSIFRSLLSSVKKTSEKSSEPKSYSFNILSKAVESPSTTLFKKLTKASKVSDTQADFESLIPKTRKRLMSQNGDMETAGSELHLVVTTAPNKNDNIIKSPNPRLSSATPKIDRIMTEKTTNTVTSKYEKLENNQERGLRSGFFT